MRDALRATDRDWRTLLTDSISVLSFAAICGSMALTVGDILVRLASRVAAVVTGVNPGWGLLGLVDLTQLAMMIAAPLAIAAAFIAGEHIRVDLVLDRLSRSKHRIAMRLTALIGAGVMGVCLYTAWTEMRGQLDFTTTSATLGIAYTWYWIPLIAGLGLSLVGCVFAVIWPSDKGAPDV